MCACWQIAQTSNHHDTNRLAIVQSMKKPAPEGAGFVVSVWRGPQRGRPLKSADFLEAERHVE